MKLVVVTKILQEALYFLNDNDIIAFSDHYVVVIVCQQKCLQKLSTFGMEELENFVSEHFNYLQFAYYNCKLYPLLHEPRHEKTCLRCFGPGETQTGLLSYKS